LNLVLYLAATTAGLFGFFFFAEHTSTHSSFVYLQYTCLLLAFWMLIVAIKEYTSGRPAKQSYRDKSNARRQSWLDQKSERRARRRF